MKIFKINQHDYVLSPSASQFFLDSINTAIAEGVTDESVIFDKDTGINLKIFKEITLEKAEEIFVQDERNEANDEFISMRDAYERELPACNEKTTYMFATFARITYLKRYSIDVCPFRVTTKRKKK